MARELISPEEEWAPRLVGQDRRASARYPATLGRCCCAVADRTNASWLAHVRDVSTLGVGLLLPQRLEPGILLEVELASPDGAHVRPILARVVYAAEDTEGEWSIGCAFAAELTDEELRLFRAERTRPGLADGRRWLRYPCNVETACYTALTAPGERVAARILNVAPGGIGLLLPCEFESGTLLHFELPAPPGQEPVRKLVRVVRAIERGGVDWFHGCEFVDQLGEDELRALSL